MPPQWSWHFRALHRLRDRLCHHSGDIVRSDALPGSMPADEPAPAELERLWAELLREADPLFEVDNALQRIDDGLYEFCEETGRSIPPERLRARPWTRYCRIVSEQTKSPGNLPPS